jgi:hypothetical protein
MRRGSHSLSLSGPSAERPRFLHRFLEYTALKLPISLEEERNYGFEIG